MTHQIAEQTALEQLHTVLTPTCFPAEREDLLAEAVRHRAPTSVLRLLWTLPSGQSWCDVSAVAAHLSGVTARLA